MKKNHVNIFTNKLSEIIGILHRLKYIYSLVYIYILLIRERRVISIRVSKYVYVL